ncbi:ABC transporter permease subunit [Streptomyces neyagawaensis]|uniref:ABC transporter permease subunit n=2 Tax=Streptomyces neyagawaensis TaxID=42238 RepID=UPI00201CB75D|nr:ABC transporter permease subunit [Streptomyces neyagawaensis]MCL6736984.1 ABC transporter permease subunit [Streptomyces neyagawaensis]MDE1687320.1 ABC transporter permease subunit [Streptomyces neyagawaensis]
MTSAVAATATAARQGPRLRGLTWTVLRVHRPALLVWCAYVLLMTGWMFWVQYVSGARVRAEMAACRRVEGGCIDVMTFSHSMNEGWIGTLIAYASYGIAAWAGASLIGRELERGTAQLAWAQSISPTRWLTAKLAVPAVALTVGTTVLVLVYRWFWTASQDLRGSEWHDPDPFLNRGPAVLAYALCALAVGALAGIALRRSLPALAVAFGLILWFHLYVDRHWHELWPARTLSGTGGSWFPSQHPASHFWPLHLMTTSVILTVAVVATGAAYWLLRRRTR